MPRGICYLLALLGLALIPSVHATALLVKTDGTTIVVSVSREEGDTIYYETQRSEGEKSLPKAEVEAIFERAASGISDTYNIEEIDAILAKMDALSEKHPDAKRDIQRFASEYRKVKRKINEADSALPSLELAIDLLVAEYTYSDRDAESYTRITTALEMVAYSEVTGSLNSKVESINKDIRKDFLTLNMARLSERAAGTGNSIEEFIAIKALADSLNTARPAGKQQKEIDQIVAWSRAVTYRHNLEALSTGLGEAPTVDQFLVAHAILNKLARYVAVGKQKDALEEKREAIYAIATEANPDYDFTLTSFEGYPLTADDAMLINQHGRFLTYLSERDDDSDRSAIPAIAFPTAKFEVVAPTEQLKMNIRIIYRYPPPKNADFRMTFIIGSDTRTAQLQDIAIADGHGNGHIEATFAKLPGKTLAALKADANGSGRANIRARIEASTNGGKSWQPQTRYMYIPLQVAEPEVYERD